MFILHMVRKVGEGVTYNLVNPSLEARVQRLGKISAIEQCFSNYGLLPNNNSIMVPNNGDEINL